MTAHFVLYVRDQDTSTTFWRAALDRTPRLHVPGMTEFDLAEGAVLGLMPEAGIRRLLHDRLEVTPRASRAELYLLVPDPAAAHARALAAGAVELDPVRPRDWGHTAAYCLDPDGHVLAFAAPTAEP